MATDDYVSRAFLVIDGQTVDCKSITPKVSNNSEPVKTMNRAGRAKGKMSGVPDIELSAVVPMPEGGHIVDFDTLCLESTYFSAHVEYRNGKTKEYNPAWVADVEHASEEGSSTDTTLTIKALDTASS